MDEWIAFITALKESLSATEGALLGTVIGSGITWLAGSWQNRRLKEIEADNAYNAKLLDKQMQIYEALEKALEPFFSGVAWGRVMLPRIFCYPEAFHQVRRDLKMIQLKARWMTRETQEDLQVVMSNLHKLEATYQLEEEGEIDRIEMIHRLIPFTDELIKHISGLLDSSHRDVTTLHRRKKRKPVYYAPSEIVPRIQAELKRHPLTLEALQGSEGPAKSALPSPGDTPPSE